MFAGFNLSMSETEFEEISSFSLKGEELFNNQKKYVKDTLDKYVNPDGSLDAEMLEEDWFASENAHVVLSHSHSDENIVKKLAGCLFSKSGIKCFIDSCVWGYANDLLKVIDDRYCKTIKNKDGSLSYDYNIRNQSTSHIHMLLNGALAKMINKTECLIFLNTPNSIKIQDITEEAKTASPWIYSELLMATEFPHQELSYYREIEHGNHPTYEFAELSLEYNVRINKLTPLTFSDLKEIRIHNNPIDSLDCLYTNKKLIHSKNIKII